MNIRVLKKPLQSELEAARILAMETVTRDFPLKLRDDLRANSDGVSCVRMTTGTEVYSSDRFMLKEILVEAWLSGEGVRYRRVLCLKVRRKEYPGK